MGFNYSPKIVTDGLVLCLDAANSRSYPGSGTTWFDLSGNGNNGTLANGPTFNANNNGSIVFDGTNDYVEITNRNTNLEFQPSQAFTVSTWFKTTTIPTTGSLVANMLASGTFSGYDLWFNGSNQMACHLINSWNTDAVKVKVDYNYNNFLNVWKNIIFTYLTNLYEQPRQLRRTFQK
jgi:hypothetical protein